ncbi:hypothetical protein EV401DRAFT_1893930 [Pisolithus croceorrhizus]|nr:hypothetical protein EV401DRAFT_1893930 [Pisolithus croceorrhizus]
MTESEDYEVHLIMRLVQICSACGDDAAGLKIAIVGWLMGSQKTPDDRAHICNFHPDYLMTTNPWPHFLYKYSTEGGQLNIKLQFALLSYFNYEAFYNNIASFFEDCYIEQEKAETAKLLLWWNHNGKDVSCLNSEEAVLWSSLEWIAFDFQIYEDLMQNLMYISPLLFVLLPYQSNEGEKMMIQILVVMICTSVKP